MGSFCRELPADPAAFPARVVRRALPLALCLLLAGLALGRQEPPGTLLRIDGDRPGIRLGTSLACAGDVDGDGTPDLAVGAPHEPASSVLTGRVDVYSGRTGLRLLQVFGDAGLDLAGFSIAPAGDLDGDGRDDVLLGLPGSDLGGLDAGLARVVSGRDGSTLREFPGLAPGERLGTRVARVGDVDGDGTRDFLLGAPDDDSAGPEAGRYRVFSGATGLELGTGTGSAHGQRLGSALLGLSDVDGDLCDDLLVGAAPQAPGQPGFVLLLSGATGALLRRFESSQPGDGFGSALAALDDVDGDGLGDFAAGAPLAETPAGRTGLVVVLSTGAGRVWRYLPGELPGEQFGAALAGIADLDGDGLGELLIGAPLAGGGGELRALSPISGAPLRTWAGPAGGDRFGAALAAFGDLDGDGSGEIVVGSPRADAGGIDSGTAHVLTSGEVAPAVYCTAKVNSQGCKPAIGWLGSPTLSGPDDFAMTARHVLNGKVGIGFYGTAPAALPFLGGVKCVASPVKRSPLLDSGGNPPPDDCSGLYTWPLTQAELLARGLAGTRIYAQFWSRDPALPDGTGAGLSDALELRIWP